ncbi:MAG: hypothetical protein IPL87_03500 [Candidatus Moraniibacteriota bacterium]|nr:MAG: hypothetical protein IPL87_03500 [Candidatus Moranbacteria bacterium]
MMTTESSRIEPSWDEEEPEKESQTRKYRWSFFLLAVFFVVGFLFGTAAKTLAGKRITVGYDDHTVSSWEREAVDMNALQQTILARQEAERKQQEEAEKKASQPASPSVPENLPPLPPTPEPPSIPLPQ